MSYASQVLADSPNGWWRLNETDSPFVDSSGHAHDASGPTVVQVNGATFVTDGNHGISTTAGQYLEAADNADFDLGDVFTLESWVKIDSYAVNRTMLSKDTGAYEYRYATSGGHLSLQLLRAGITAIVTATVILPEDNAWHHAVATKNGATVKLYQDGVDVTGSVTNDTCANTGSPLRICGTPVDGNTIDKPLDEVAVYPTALTQARVVAHYNAATTADTGPGDNPPIGLLGRGAGW